MQVDNAGQVNLHATGRQPHPEGMLVPTRTRNGAGNGAARLVVAVGLVPIRALPTLEACHLHRMNRQGARAMLTPEQADAGLLEFVVPDGENVVVDLGDEGLHRPAVEADVAQILLDLDDGQDAYQAIRTYAETAGIPHSFYLGRNAIVIKLG